MRLMRDVALHGSGNFSGNAMSMSMNYLSLATPLAAERGETRITFDVSR